MSVVFSTSELSQRDRIPYWVDVATQAYFKHGFEAPAETFVGNLSAEKLDSIVLSSCDCGPCHVTRTRQDVARDDIDDLILCVRLSGRSIFKQGDREVVVGPGTVMLQDCGRPMEVEFLELSKSIFVSVPRASPAGPHGWCGIFRHRVDEGSDCRPGSGISHAARGTRWNAR